MCVKKCANRVAVVAGMEPKYEPQCVVAGEAACVQRLAEIQIQYLGGPKEARLKKQQIRHRGRRDAVGE